MFENLYFIIINQIFILYINSGLVVTFVELIAPHASVLTILAIRQAVIYKNNIVDCSSFVKKNNEFIIKNIDYMCLY